MDKTICRLNYIGSKYKLLDWIVTIIKEKSGWDTLEDKHFADLFAGTGIVSLHLRNLGAIVTANDAELYSYIITSAFALSSYNSKIEEIIKELNDSQDSTVGYITTHYSPYNANERKFFTIENAMRIDYFRTRIEEFKEQLTKDEYNFLLASLIVSADAVSNVPAVYGCYLKNFKDKAKKNIVLQAIHMCTDTPKNGSIVFNSDVISQNMLENLQSSYFDVVYLDPPYNERQYSKNYFPLNIIAKTPEQLTDEPALKGKTGIPANCFISAFCKRNMSAQNSFKSLLKNIKSKWIFVSYNSESIVSKQEMIEIMQEYGNVSIVEQDYKRFKSF